VVEAMPLVTAVDRTMISSTVISEASYSRVRAATSVTPSAQLQSAVDATNYVAVQVKLHVPLSWNSGISSASESMAAWKTPPVLKREICPIWQAVRPLKTMVPSSSTSHVASMFF